MERFGYIVTWRDNKAVKLYKDGTIEDIENDCQAPLKDLIKKWRSDQPITPGGIEARAFAKAYKNKKTK